MNKEQMKDLLRQGECEIVFTKKNGDERQMVCTLHPDYLPVMEEGDGTRRSPETEQTIVVWDVEANGWRSFRIDSLISGPTLIN